MALNSKKAKWVSPTLSNPLISKLGLINDKRIFFSQVEERPDQHFDISDEDARERKRILGTEFYVPSDLTWEVYNAISEMLEFGYRYKNIAYPSYYADMNRAILGVDEEKMHTGHVESTVELEMGGVVIGPAGFGKTEAINRALKLIPDRILHPAKDTAYQKPFLQIPFIKADINGRSTLSLLQGLLKSIDAKAGSAYYENNPQRKGEGQLIEAVANACWLYGIGLIVLDEAQAFVTESGKAKGKDSPNAKFLQRLFNSVKVPILLIGTPEVEEFLSCNAHTFRRYKKDADIVYKNYGEDSRYWQELVRLIIQQYVFCSEVKINDTQMHQIHLYTAGNYSALQIYCKALIQYVEDSGVTRMSMDLLNDVYEIKKSAINQLVRFHGLPTKSESKASFTTNSESSRKVVPAPDDDLHPESLAMQECKKLGRAAHDVFRNRA